MAQPVVPRRCLPAAAAAEHRPEGEAGAGPLDGQGNVPLDARLQPAAGVSAASSGAAALRCPVRAAHQCLTRENWVGAVVLRSVAFALPTARTGTMRAVENIASTTASRRRPAKQEDDTTGTVSDRAGDISFHLQSRAAALMLRPFVPSRQNMLLSSSPVCVETCLACGTTGRSAKLIPALVKQPQSPLSALVTVPYQTLALGTCNWDARHTGRWQLSCSPSR